MAKKTVTQEEVVEEKLNKYISQREELENLINKYLELYQKLNGAIEATQDILSDIHKEKDSGEAT